MEGEFLPEYNITDRVGILDEAPLKVKTIIKEIEKAKRVAEVAGIKITNNFVRETIQICQRIEHIETKNPLCLLISRWIIMPDGKIDVQKLRHASEKILQARDTDYIRYTTMWLNLTQ